MPWPPAEPVRTSIDLLDDPQLRHRGYLQTLNHEQVGEEL